MERKGSFRCAAQSLPMRSNRSESAVPRSRRTRFKRSRTASVTASVMLSPVSLANARVRLCASLFFIFRPMWQSFYHRHLPFYRTGLRLATAQNGRSNLRAGEVDFVPFLEAHAQIVEKSLRAQIHVNGHSFWRRS